MIKLATVNVPMTSFKVDVIIGGTKKEYQELLKKRYGLQYNQSEDSHPNECTTIDTGKYSELKGETIFVLKLKHFPRKNLPVFIHELWHLIWRISYIITDFELNNNCNTWAAYLIEDISNQILNAKFETINPFKS
jgi:hypothetical protein